MTAFSPIYSSFGVAATYTPKGGAGSSVTVLIDDAPDMAEDGGVVRGLAKIQVRQSEVSARPVYRSTFLIGSTTWTIVDDGVRELHSGGAMEAEWECYCSTGERLPI